ncbi:MAG TPA: DUF3147 family protein [Steroidobacteraceae bacterium]|nr:DUF3147 family protein [Steroidobacteraceae bacterium]
MSWSALADTSWYQYALRFVLGGLVTVGTGLVAEHFGPVVGGLFLAFPAIFPATATLIDARERRKKEKQGLKGDARGLQAAALDAAGAVLGAIGLMCFAGFVWKALPRVSAVMVLCGAALLWLIVSISLWWLRKHHWL